MINKLTLTVETVDEVTGEITSEVYDIYDLIADKLKRATAAKKSKAQIITDDTPKLILSDTKYSLSTGAMQLIGVEPGGEDKVDIQYQKIGKLEYPIIGLADAFGSKGGNKVTKSGTVRYSGVKHNQLAEFGTEFILVRHPNSSTLFILTQDGIVPEGNATIESFQHSKEVKSVKPKKEVPQPEPEDTTDLEDLLNSSTEELTTDDFSL